MKNLTISLPEAVLARLKLLAAKRKQSVNRFVGELLNDMVTGQTSEDWEAEHRALSNQVKGLRSTGAWTREEIYEDRAS